MKLRLIGKLMKRSNKLHIFALGHFLEGSGEVLDLSSKIDWNDVGIRHRTCLFPFDTNSQTKYAIGEMYSIDENQKGAKDPQYNTWGKAVVVVDPDAVDIYSNKWYWCDEKHNFINAIMDTYVFYPWCGEQDHFANCNCRCRSWNTTTLKHTWKTIKSKDMSKYTYHQTYKFLTIVTNTNNNVAFKIGLGTRNPKLRHTKLKLRGTTARMTIFKVALSRYETRYEASLEISDWVVSKLGKAYQYYAIRP